MTWISERLSCHNNNYSKDCVKGCTVAVTVHMQSCISLAVFEEELQVMLLKVLKLLIPYQSPCQSLWFFFFYQYEVIWLWQKNASMWWCDINSSDFVACYRLFRTIVKQPALTLMVTESTVCLFILLSPYLVD